MNTARTKLTRLPKRGSHDTETIYSILDAALICHISYHRDGQPFIIPTAFCRINDTLYIHGSVGSHFFRELARGVDVCVAVTFIDGLVLARSAFSHSVNYRSVVAFGKSRLVDDEAESWLALERITEQIMPGRWADTRQPSASELKKTMVIAIPIEEASAKVRTGGVNDDAEDLDLPYWAGVVPLSLTYHEPVPDERLKSNTPLPSYLTK